MKIYDSKGLLLLLGRKARGKRGTNMFNWRNIFEHYFKKILSMFYFMYLI